ncbi:MAG: hypothetical protein IPJ13_24075 [Saprospiraceae bacterium]|nr:hypothetical protein [Saprospiraceae bacterium]
MKAGNPCRPFDQHPNLDLNDPNLKFLDVNGDGLPDIILSMENEFLWYAGPGRKGYDDYEVAQKLMMRKKGPRVLFSDSDDRFFDSHYGYEWRWFE